MIPGTPEEGSKGQGPTEDSTFNKMKVLLYTQRTEDIIDVLGRLWKDEIEIEELKAFIGRHFYDPRRRDAFFFVVYKHQRGSGPNPLKSRVFKETFEFDVWADYQERLLRVDSLSAAAGQLGAKRPMRFTDIDTVSNMSDVLGL